MPAFCRIIWLQLQTHNSKHLCMDDDWSGWSWYSSILYLNYVFTFLSRHLIIYLKLNVTIFWPECMWITANIFKYQLCFDSCLISCYSLQWRHNESDCVSNHQPRDCLLNRLFKAQIRENIKAQRHWPLWGEFMGDQWFPHIKGQ